MVGISFALILSGILIFAFSFVIKFGKKDFDRDFSEAVRNFEKQKALEKFNENIDNQTEKSDNIKENLYDTFEEDFEKTQSEEDFQDMVYDENYESDDEDFGELMKQSKAFVRLVGIALIVIGVVSFFINGNIF